MEDIKKGQELENIHDLNKTQEAKKCPHCAKFKNHGKNCEGCQLLAEQLKKDREEVAKLAQVVQCLEWMGQDIEEHQKQAAQALELMEAKPAEFEELKNKAAALLEFYKGQKEAAEHMQKITERSGEQWKAQEIKKQGQG